MVLKILFLFFCATAVNCQYKLCDSARTLTSPGQSVSINHLATTGNCRYIVISPPDTFIRVSCQVRTTCNVHNFLVSRAGDKGFSDGWTYCNTSPAFTSIGNEVVVALDNRGATTLGSFTCTFTAASQTDSDCDCGWSVDTKIVGGTNTGINEFNSHAGIVNTGTKEIYCGASIISQYWSVTAAHCIDAQPLVSKSVLLVGDWDVRTGTDTTWAKVYAIAQFIKHPNYVAESNLHDIGLVKTNDYIKYNYAVGPACLPFFWNQDPLVDWYFTAVGWGTTSFGGPTSPILQKTSLRVVSTSECRKTYGYNAIDVTKICTFGDKVRDTCGMDSGGGLYYQYAYGRRYFMAVVNYGQYCASSAPSVNSRVDRYISWIQPTTGALFCRRT